MILTRVFRMFEMMGWRIRNGRRRKITMSKAKMTGETFTEGVQVIY